MTGRLYGVGLGPGDPELVTQAARLIRDADVIAFHAGVGKQSNARRIAADLIPASAIEEELRYPVTTGPTAHPGGYAGAMAEFYEECASRLASAPRAGPYGHGAGRGRPAVLRLVHVPPRPARPALRDRGRPGRAGLRRCHRRPRLAARAADRRAHRAAPARSTSPSSRAASPTPTARSS